MAFVVARLLLVAAAVHAHKGLPGAADLSRGDSYNYLSIAAHGYILHPCPPRCVSGVNLPWSGNSGWFPLYPMLLAPFAWLGAGQTAGAFLSAVCQLGTYAVLWLGFIRGCTRWRAVGLMALAAVFPGAVYLVAVFPLSLLTLVLACGLWLLQREHPRGVITSAFLATLAYPLGILFGVSVVAAGRRATALRAIAVSALALVFVAASQRLMTGHWNAYLLAQAGRGHGLHDPLTELLSAKSSTLSFFHGQVGADGAPALQSALAVLIAVVAVVIAVVSRRFALDRSVGALVLMCWLEPLLIGGVSLYRTDVVLLPALLLFRRLPAPVVVAFVVIAAPIAYWMSVFYFQSRFV
jgi:hypothetical protein